MLRCSSGIRQSLLLMAGLVAGFFLFPQPAAAQETKKIDQIKTFFNNQEHSATKAVVYSAILPGWGQAYNKKYWKIPIVYAGFAGAAYLIKTNGDSYKLYKSDYLLLEADPGATTVSGLSKSLIRLRIDSYRRNRDLSIIGLFAWYGLGLIDANVDGHFFNYDIDEDLTMSINPWLSDQVGLQQALGVSLNFRWR